MGRGCEHEAVTLSLCQMCVLRRVIVLVISVQDEGGRTTVPLHVRARGKVAAGAPPRIRVPSLVSRPVASAADRSALACPAGTDLPSTQQPISFPGKGVVIGPESQGGSARLAF